MEGLSPLHCCDGPRPHRALEGVNCHAGQVRAWGVVDRGESTPFLRDGAPHGTRLHALCRRSKGTLLKAVKQLGHANTWVHASVAESALPF